MLYRQLVDQQTAPPTILNSGTKSLIVLTKVKQQTQSIIYRQSLVKTLYNAENDYFDQRLACAAPKCWSKYTTYIHIHSGLAGSLQAA